MPLFHVYLQQLKEKVAELERQLIEEQQKSEDLQFSIDEAVCGGDQSVSTMTKQVHSFRTLYM